MSHGGTKGEQDKKYYYFCCHYFVFHAVLQSAMFQQIILLMTAINILGRDVAANTRILMIFIKYAIKTLFNGQIIIILRSNMLIGN